MMRFREFGKYRLDRWLFQGCMYLSFAFLLFVAWHYHFEMDYFKCIGGSDGMGKLVSDDFCKNPFFNEGNKWKSMEYLPPGEYGTRLDGLFQWVYPGVFGIFGMGILINHFWHNRKYKIEVVDDEEGDGFGLDEDGAGSDREAHKGD